MNTGTIGLIAAAVLAAGCSGTDGGNDWMDPTHPPATVDSAGNPVLPPGMTPADTSGAVAVAPAVGTGPDTSGGVAPGVAPVTPGVEPGVSPAQPVAPNNAPASQCSPGRPATSQIPRITNVQYERTAYDLLGTTSPGLLATAQERAITKPICDPYRSSADSLAATVM